MKVFILTVFIFASAFADDDAKVNVDEAQFPMMHPGMNPMMPPMMGGMNPMMPPMMGGMNPGMSQNYGPTIDYSMRCSNSCGCAQMCIPMMPCPCVCPPPCSPEQTTTNQPEVSAGPKCENGAPDFAFPDCCWNGGRGQFCCQNGANNLHCCLNGANNPWCSLPTQPPSQVPTPSPPGSDDCNQCRCQPCIPWVPCPPCPCQQRCGCQGSSCGGGWGK